MGYKPDIFGDANLLGKREQCRVRGRTHDKFEKWFFILGVTASQIVTIFYFEFKNYIFW